MNCLFVSELANLGGGETSLLNLVEEFHENKIVNISVLCFEEGDLAKALRERNIEVHIYPLNKNLKKGKIFNALKYFKLLLKEKNINIIQTNDWKTSITLKAISKILFLNKIRCIWVCHGQWYKFDLFKKNLVNLFIDKIVAVSTAVEENLINNRINKKNIVKMPLGIKLDKFKNLDSKKVRKELNIKSEEIVFSNIGRFQEIKGQKLLIEAIYDLKNKGYKFKTLFIGDSIFNNEKDHMYKNECIELISKYDLKDRCKFLGLREDIPEILKGIDALVVPSINESFGMVIIEAFATGTLVVSTPGDGPKEIINNEVNGFLLKERSKEELAKVLELIINNKIDKYKFKRNMEEDAKKYSIKKIAKDYYDLYRRV